MAKRSQEDLYQEVTDRIVAALEKGVRPWTQPWNTTGGLGLPLRSTGQAYQGVNVWLLLIAAMEKGYVNPRWMTLAQANKLGGSVRKGEKSTSVVFFKPFIVTETLSNGDKIEKKIPMLREFRVFNVEQIEKLPESFYATKKPITDTPKEKLERIACADEYFGALKATIKHGGNCALYNRQHDFIQMPDFDQFLDAESYYATLAHEFVHWTGHESRLKREFGARFGDNAYAAEELVAEMGSAFICAALNLSLTPREDHAQYLGHWIKTLKADKKAIFTASRAAQTAVEFLAKQAGIKTDAPANEADEVKEAA